MLVPSVFGIPMFATILWSEEKLNHVASILAELIDNNNDGCADDPDVLSMLLEWREGGLQAAALLPTREGDANSASEALEAAGISRI